jgi:hypothetical protein
MKIEQNKTFKKLGELGCVFDIVGKPLMSGISWR